MTPQQQGRRILIESQALLTADNFLVYDEHEEGDALTDDGHVIAPESKHAHKWTLMGAFYRSQRLNGFTGESLDGLGELLIKAIDHESGTTEPMHNRMDAWEEIGYWELYESNDSHEAVDNLLQLAIQLSNLQEITDE